MSDQSPPELKIVAIIAIVVALIGTNMVTCVGMQNMAGKLMPDQPVEEPAQ